MLSLGGHLFRARGWLPLPLLTAQLVLEKIQWPAGFLVLLIGEAVRLWAVGHIGGVSRTRESAVGTLVRAGPYGRLRNPLYLGNILMWVGLGLAAGPLWAGLWAAWMLGQYALIVRWEEARLTEQIGAPYLDYCRDVPRWWPGGPGGEGSWSAERALRSEWRTLLAAAAVPLVWLGLTRLRG